MLFNKIFSNTNTTQTPFSQTNIYPTGVAGPRKKAITKVDMPTLLPPGGPAEDGASISANSKKNHFSAVTQTIGKVKGYFSRLGRAIVGMNDSNHADKHKRGGKVTANMLKTNSDEASATEDDPMVGRWPLGFAQPNVNVPLPAASNASIQNNSRPTSNPNSSSNAQTGSQEEFDTESFAEKPTGNDFADIMGQLNSSQDNQQAIMNLIKGGSGGLGDGGGGLF